MVEPITDFDREVLRHRKIAKRVAHNVARKFGCDWEELESPCWVGVAKALQTYVPDRCTLSVHLYRAAKYEAYVEARRWARKGFWHVPKGTGRIHVERLLFDIACQGEEQEPWDDAAWTRALRPLSARLRRVFELRYRHGRSVAEIAAELGYKSAVVVSSILSRHAADIAEFVSSLGWTAFTFSRSVE